MTELPEQAPEDRDRTAEDRDRTAENRDPTAEDRDRTAEYRDRTAEDRDRTAEDRDRTAEDRDRTAEDRSDAEAAFYRGEDRRGSEPGRRTTDVSAALDRADAASDRADAAMDREGAAFDREAAVGRRKGGARDRTQAADDREAASADRVTSAKDREASSIDELTGAHRRGAGLLELERDITRAKRTRQPFVLAFVDVDGLKVTNDSLGHAAGDQVLCQVVDALRRHLRSYDLIIRFGGDEFVCSLMDLTMAEAAKRFALIDADLAAAHRVSVTAGLAELQSDDSLEDLIARADEALYQGRRQHPATRD